MRERHQDDDAAQTRLGSRRATVIDRSGRRLPTEVSILLVLLGIALVFEVLGWIVIGQSFLANKQRLSIMVLQVSVIGIIAVGVTQVIITGGVDLSSGSVVGVTAMVAASFAQTSTMRARFYPDALTGLPADRRRSVGRPARRPVRRLRSTAGSSPRRASRPSSRRSA